MNIDAVDIIYYDFQQNTWTYSDWELIQLLRLKIIYTGLSRENPCITDCYTVFYQKYFFFPLVYELSN